MRVYTLEMDSGNTPFTLGPAEFMGSSEAGLGCRWGLADHQRTAGRRYAWPYGLVCDLSAVRTPSTRTAPQALVRRCASVTQSPGLKAPPSAVGV